MHIGQFVAVEKDGERLGLHFIDRNDANKTVLDLRAKGYNALLPEEYDIYTDSAHAVSVAQQFFEEYVK